MAKRISFYVQVTFADIKLLLLRGVSRYFILTEPGPNMW